MSKTPIIASAHYTLHYYYFLFNRPRAEPGASLVVAWQARPISFMAGLRPRSLVTGFHACAIQAYSSRRIIFWVKSKIDVRQRGNTICPTVNNLTSGEVTILKCLNSGITLFPSKNRNYSQTSATGAYQSLHMTFESLFRKEVLVV